MTDDNKERLKQLGWGDVLKAPPAITPTWSRGQRLEKEIVRLATWLDRQADDTADERWAFMLREQAELARRVMWKIR